MLVACPFLVAGFQVAEGARGEDHDLEVFVLLNETKGRHDVGLKLSHDLVDEQASRRWMRNRVPRPSQSNRGMDPDQSSES